MVAKSLVAATPARRSARTVDPATDEILEGEADGDTRVVRPFSDFLTAHQHGELHDELSELLNRLVTAVQGIGKGGTLTLVVAVKPAGRSHNQVFVAGKATLKLPEPDPAESIFFVDRDGNLTRKNPDQLELPFLRRVEGATVSTSNGTP